MAFDDIMKKIDEEIAASKTEPVTVAAKAAPEGEPGGTVQGTPVAKPGTERVTFDAQTFQMMECITSATGMKKQRYCVVEKNVRPKYGNQFVNSNGFRTHVITREAYILLTGVLASARAQIKKLSDALERVEEQRDLFKMTIDALRKNGVID
jgi:BMFP domain-containing protein YqiC